jgi:hypothetical protein
VLAVRLADNPGRVLLVTASDAQRHEELAGQLAADVTQLERGV